SSTWRKNLDVNVILQNQESKTQNVSMTQGDFEVTRYAWNADYNNTTSFLDIFTSVNTNNHMRYQNEEFDKWALKADETNDPADYQ
ncbi:oligopeptide ABC transporter substrate-binding protein OppA, partial [Xenorhabdus bovienii]|nr:oligopeptide ABC transporter substrate-binding protein OppA [Xenorhabdus bovienii]